MPIESYFTRIFLHSSCIKAHVSLVNILQQAQVFVIDCR